MVMVLAGNGSITGVSSMPTAVTFGSTLATASRGISNASVPAGSLLQVVTASTTTVTSTTSSSLVSTGFSCSITPTSSSSKIFILVSAFIAIGSGTNQGFGLAVYRGANQVYYDGTNYAPGYIQMSGNWRMKSNIMYLDSPATTSSTTYTLYFNAYSSTVSFSSDTGSSPSTMTLMEIAQ